MDRPMMESISEIDMFKYTNEYNELECKNLSLEEFISNCHQKKLKDKRDIAKYDTLAKGLETMNGTRIFGIPPANCLPRTIIIDGANVMHGGSIYHDTRSSKSGVKIPDVAALLSVVRYFVVRNFEVIVVISRKYTLKDATNFNDAIAALVKHHLCVIAPHTNLDDTICLDLADQVNGVVVTTDKYRDHATETERYARIVVENRLHIDWNEVNERNRNKITTRDSDFVCGKKFEFYHDNDMEMTMEEVYNRIYAKKDTVGYEISRERIELTEPEKKKTRILAVLSNLIDESISVCPQRATEIVSSPVQGPPAPPTDEQTEQDENRDLEDMIALYEGDDIW